MLKKILFSVFFILCFRAHLFSFAAPDSTEYYSDNFLRYSNYVYQSNIKTVKLYQDKVALSEPVIDLREASQLKLEFDDIDGDYKDYWYTLVHCDWQWKPSTISQTQYLQGFYENKLSDYRYSFNTLQRYTHYSLVFPNADCRILYSGNYLLKIFLNNDQEKLVITRRLIVVENFVSVKARVHQATDIEQRNYRQEVDFVIQHPNYAIQNPFGDLHAVILQNGRWDNAITNLKPLYLKNNELDYDYDQDNVFISGSEFRNFDTRSLKYETQNVQSVKQTDEGVNVYLFPDKRKSSSRYSSEYDLNGKYEVRTYDGSNDETGADYATVHFSLPMDEPVNDGNFYVFGELTDWNYLRQARLIYNYDKKMYEASLYLKQGYYNYEYVFLKDGSSIGDESVTEGSHYETQNSYLILVYYRPTGSRYDSIIGIGGAH